MSPSSFLNPLALAGIRPADTDSRTISAWIPARPRSSWVRIDGTPPVFVARPLKHPGTVIVETDPSRDIDPTDRRARDPRRMRHADTTATDR